MYIIIKLCIIFITIIKVVKMLSLCRKASSTGWKIEWSIPLQCAMLSGVGTSSCSSDSASTSACTGHNGRAGYSDRPGHCSRTGHNGGPGDSSRAGYSGHCSRTGHNGGPDDSSKSGYCTRFDKLGVREVELAKPLKQAHFVISCLHTCVVPLMLLLREVRRVG